VLVIQYLKRCRHLHQRGNLFISILIYSTLMVTATTQRKVKINLMTRSPRRSWFKWFLRIIFRKRRARWSYKMAQKNNKMKSLTLFRLKLKVVVYSSILPRRISRKLSLSLLSLLLLLTKTKLLLKFKLQKLSIPSANRFFNNWDNKLVIITI